MFNKNDPLPLTPAVPNLSGLVDWLGGMGDGGEEIV